MKLKSLVALLVVAVMIFAACNTGGGTGDAAPPADTPAATTDTAATDTPADTADAPAAGDREQVRFRMHYFYDWYSFQPWAGDAVTRHWGEMFNIYMYQQRPDANPEEVLNLMIAADDLPDVIWMERSPQNVQMARLGLFVPVDEMVARSDNNWYHENVMASTQRFFEIDGVNYIIPNWARMGVVGVPGGATGGNEAWMVTTNAWEAVGSPSFATFYDLFDYAVAIRDADLTNAAGVPMVPMLFNGGPNYGVDFVNQAVYRSFGGHGPNGGWWWGLQEDGTMGSRFRVPLWREAVLETNRWVREGLIPVTNFTNTYEEFLANLNTGRGGLVFYDHSQDDGNSFRRILREGDPGNSIEVVTIPGAGHGGADALYPPAFGIPPVEIYHQVHETLGWNGSFITRSAAEPDRIFEFLTWLLTPMGSIEMMFGPPGYMWDELDANGYPILHTPPGVLTSEELRDIGAWNWAIAGHANNVDNAKFAANAALPEDQRNWVETIQQTIFTPNMMLSDEFVAINLVIDPGTDLHISRTLIEDTFEAQFPLILMADSREEAERMFDELLAFAEANGMAGIEEVYNARYQENVAMQGGSVFSPPVMR
ncbi:MAG: hypothetical protein FWD03_04795 [Defluviitaleaceae bacterium]|nr:hypothetical protein [Defluviitaleaceae bacterium]